MRSRSILIAFVVCVGFALGVSMMSPSLSPPPPPPPLPSDPTRPPPPLAVQTRFTETRPSSVLDFSLDGPSSPPGSSLPPTASSSLSSSSSLPRSVVDIMHDIVFSCFFFRSDFYHGRKVPSLDWILVMIESAYEHRRRTSLEACATKSFTDSVPDAPAGGAASGHCEMRMVLFVDADTRGRLLSAIRARALAGTRAKPRPDFVALGFLELVLIDTDGDSEFAAVYRRERWANPDVLGNSANNFRFWLIRRYLRELWKRSVWAPRADMLGPMGDELATTASTPEADDRDEDGRRITSTTWGKSKYDLETTSADLAGAAATTTTTTTPADGDASRPRKRNRADIESLYVQAQTKRRALISAMRILISDATDVLFQRNPFDDGVCFPAAAATQESFFLYTLEDRSKTFRNEKYNRRWMRCYDKAHDKHLERIAASQNESMLERREQLKRAGGGGKKPAKPKTNWTSPLAEMSRLQMRVSCAGVSLGSFFGVLAYLTAQLREISNPTLTECAVSDIKAALDQATHNYLMLQSIWRPRDQLGRDNEPPESKTHLLSLNAGGAADSWSDGVRIVATSQSQFHDSARATERLHATRVVVAAVPTFAERNKARADDTPWDRWMVLQAGVSEHGHAHHRSVLNAEMTHMAKIVGKERAAELGDVPGHFERVAAPDHVKHEPGERVEAFTAPTWPLSSVKVEQSGGVGGGGSALRATGADCVFHGNFARLHMHEGTVVSPWSAASAADERGVHHPFAIVHQYTSDRHPSVMKAAKKRYDL